VYARARSSLPLVQHTTHSPTPHIVQGTAVYERYITFFYGRNEHLQRRATLDLTHGTLLS
jgi:hypothetical protein